MDRDDATNHDAGERAPLGPALRVPGVPKAERLAELLEQRAPMVRSPTGRAYALVGNRFVRDRQSAKISLQLWLVATAAICAAIWRCAEP